MEVGAAPPRRSCRTRRSSFTRSEYPIGCSPDRRLSFLAISNSVSIFFGVLEFSGTGVVLSVGAQAPTHKNKEYLANYISFLDEPERRSSPPIQSRNGSTLTRGPLLLMEASSYFNDAMLSPSLALLFLFQETACTHQGTWGDMEDGTEKMPPLEAKC